MKSERDPQIAKPTLFPNTCNSQKFTLNREPKATQLTQLAKRIAFLERNNADLTAYRERIYHNNSLLVDAFQIDVELPSTDFKERLDKLKEELMERAGLGKSSIVRTTKLMEELKKRQRFLEEEVQRLKAEKYQQESIISGMRGKANTLNSKLAEEIEGLNGQLTLQSNLYKELQEKYQNLEKALQEVRDRNIRLEVRISKAKESPDDRFSWKSSLVAEQTKEKLEDLGSLKSPVGHSQRPYVSKIRQREEGSDHKSSANSSSQIRCVTFGEAVDEVASTDCDNMSGQSNSELKKATLLSQSLDSQSIANHSSNSNNIALEAKKQQAQALNPVERYESYRSVCKQEYKSTYDYKCSLNPSRVFANPTSTNLTNLSSDLRKSVEILNRETQAISIATSVFLDKSKPSYYDSKARSKTPQGSTRDIFKPLQEYDVNRSVLQ